MSCECDCASCTGFCDCQRCSKPETDLLEAPRNRSGLDAIRTRIGDYGAFFTDAKRQLSAKESPNLQALGTRDPTDPTIALLDAWSVTADVLTFYRERLTQEAYLRTATDEVSLRQLANLVGFKPRPGIAATAHLAYLLDPSAKPVEINPGAKAQTVPLPGEKMQTFETDEKLAARAEWSQMKPRQSRPSHIDMLDALTRPTIRLADTSLFVRPGERVLFVFGVKLGHQVVREVLSAKTNIELGFVELTLKPRDGLVQALLKNGNLLENLIKTRDNISKELGIVRPSQDPTSLIGKHLLAVLSSYFLGADAIEVLSLLGNTAFIRQRGRDRPFKIEIDTLNGIFKEIANSVFPEPQKQLPTAIDSIFREIRKSAKGEVSSSSFISQQAKDGFQPDGVVRIELAQSMVKEFQDSLNPALRVMQPNPITVAPLVYLLRTVVSPFGAVAPKKISNADGTFEEKEWSLDLADKQGPAFLETVVDAITNDSFAIIQTPLPIGDLQNEIPNQRLLSFVRVRSCQTVARGSYNLSSKVTKLELADAVSGEPLKIIDLNLILLS
jgi:hypothetical protein